MFNSCHMQYGHAEVGLRLSDEKQADTTERERGKEKRG